MRGRVKQRKMAARFTRPGVVHLIVSADVGPFLTAMQNAVNALAAASLAVGITSDAWADDDYADPDYTDDNPWWEAEAHAMRYDRTLSNIDATLAQYDRTVI